MIQGTKQTIQQCLLSSFYGPETMLNHEERAPCHQGTHNVGGRLSASKLSGGNTTVPVTDEGAPGDRPAVITADRFQRDRPRAEDQGGCILGEARAWSRGWLCPELQNDCHVPWPGGPLPIFPLDPAATQKLTPSS